MSRATATTPSSRERRSGAGASRPRRRGIRAVGCVLLALTAATGLAVQQASPAMADITEPEPNEIVGRDSFGTSGRANIEEDTGGQSLDPFACGNLGGNTIIEVYNAAGQLHERFEKGGIGPFTAHWEYDGDPNGTYTIVSKGVDWGLVPVVGTGHKCVNGAPYEIDRVKVKVANRAVISMGDSATSTTALFPPHLVAEVRSRESLRLVGGIQVGFQVEGEPEIIWDETNSEGVASIDFPITQGHGTTRYRAIIRGDCCYLDTNSAWIPLEIEPRHLEVVNLGPTSTPATKSVQVEALIQDSALFGVPLGPGHTVTFHLEYPDGQAASDPVETVSNDMSTAIATLDPYDDAPPGDYRLVWDVEPGAAIAKYYADFSSDPDAQHSIPFTIDEAATFSLLVAPAGPGSGAVHNDVAVPCRDELGCVFERKAGTRITLHAVPDADSEFLRWNETSACVGQGADCAFYVDADDEQPRRLLFATFVKKITSVRIHRDGAGSVRDTSPDGRWSIFCPNICEGSYDVGLTRTFTATPSTGWVFTGWSGAGCEDAGLDPCEVLIGDVAEGIVLTAHFERIAHQISASTEGPGSGTVSDGGDLTCPDTCVASHPEGSTVTLTATREPGSIFSGWFGDCAGTDPVCTVRVDGPVHVTARFDVVPEVHTIPNKVEDTDDGACTVTDCSLREAVDAARQFGGAHRIPLAGRTYVLTMGELDIDDDTDITFVAGHLDADGASRLLHVAVGSAARLQDVTVRDGYAAEASGGGILNEGTLVLVRTTVSGNQADLDGGGIANLGGVMTMHSSTISGNRGASGGGIYTEAGEVTIVSSTIAANDARGSGGGFNHRFLPDSDNPPTVLKSSIIAGNTRSGPIGFGADCSTPAGTSLGFNVIGDGESCQFHWVFQADAVGVDAELFELGDNGFLTQTHPIGPSSPARDRVPLNDPDCGGLDQKGLPRPAGPGCDSGSYEIPELLSVTLAPMPAVDAGEETTIEAIPRASFIDSPTYHWSLGDGRALTTTTRTITASWPTAGTFTVTVRVTTPRGEDVTAEGQIEVLPAVNPDTYEAVEDTLLVVDAADGVLANDVGAGRATLERPALEGEATLAEDGSFTYEPFGCGTHSFVYVAGGGGHLRSAEVTLEVACVNDAPLARPDGPIAVTEDGTATVDVLANDGDEEADALSIASTDQPGHGTAAIADGQVTYSPDPDYCGADGLTYVATDGLDESAPASVTFDVACVNDPPVAVSDPTVTLEEDTSATITPMANDTDPDGDRLDFEFVDLPDHAEARFDIRDGSVTIVPEPGVCGTDAFTYRSHDGHVTSEAVTVDIEVVCVNDAPVATGDRTIVTEEDLFATASPLANDVDEDGDELTLAMVDGPDHGTTDVNEGGVVFYEPASDFCGTDAFTYVAEDGELTSEPVVVDIVVACVNDVPLAAPDSYVVDQGGSLTVPAAGVLANDRDVEDATLSASLLTGAGPEHGTLELAFDGSFTYAPEPGFWGEDTFRYAAVDSEGAPTEAEVTIRVRGATTLEAGPVMSWRSAFGFLVASLTDRTGEPVAGREVRFEVLGRERCTAVTDEDGQARCWSGLGSTFALFAGYVAHFDGDDVYAGTQDRAGFWR